MSNLSMSTLKNCRGGTAFLCLHYEYSASYSTKLIPALPPQQHHPIAVATRNEAAISGKLHACLK